ncbi:MAG: hypothetical protein KC547_22720, partial [Anaerolineae bacterium]|nr:hypothetical protein [Anaerolineae bacterium]
MIASEMARKAVRSSNRGWFISLIVLITLLVIVASVSWNAYYNAIVGPFDTPLKTILQNQTADGLREYYVSVRGDEVFNTGWEMVETEDGRETKREGYAALMYNDRFLLVELTGPFVDGVKNFTGQLVPISADVNREILEGMYADEPALRGMFASFMLDTEDKRIEIFAGLAALTVSGVISILLLGRTLNRMADPTRHPIMRALARYGDPESIAREIDTEMTLSRTPVGKYSSLSQRWFAYHRGGAFHAARLQDIAWAYKQVTQHRTYGIPTAKTYMAHVADVYGHQFSIQAGQKEVDALLKAIAERAPWALHGYSDNLAQAWRKDRQQVLGTVAERRKAYSAA